MTIYDSFKNKFITRKEATALVTRFLLQEGILEKYLNEIRQIKPYQKGNDDKKYLISYAIGLSLVYS